jgi:hypothetical protein
MGIRQTEYGSCVPSGHETNIDRAGEVPAEIHKADKSNQ